MAVSRGPRRKAAHWSGSTAKMAKGAALGISAVNRLKATAPIAPAVAKSAADSRNARKSKRRGWSVTHRTRAGVIMSTAAKSPSQRGNQIEANFCQSTSSMRLEGPRPRLRIESTLALMATTNIAINTNLAMPSGAPKALRPPAHQLTRKPPATASNALFTAVATAA